MGCISWYSNLDKLIISIDINCLGVNSASRVTTIKLCLCHMFVLCFKHGMGVVTYELREAQHRHFGNCIWLFWFFQSLFQCQTLNYLNYLVTSFCYELLLGSDRIFTELLCVFAFAPGACLLLWVMLFKSSIVFHDLSFVAHDSRQPQHTHYTYSNLRVCSVH